MERRAISEEEALRLFGDPKELGERILRFRDDQVYIDEHFEDLYYLHPEQFIAVYDKQVIASAATVEEFLEVIERDLQDNRDFAWRVLERNPKPLILSAA